VGGFYPNVTTLRSGMLSQIRLPFVCRRLSFVHPTPTQPVGARKVKSDEQVAMNKNSDPYINCFLRGGWGGECPELKFFPHFWDYPKRVELARKLIFGLQVASLPRYYRQGQQSQIPVDGTDPQSAH